MDRYWLLTWRTYGTWLPGEEGFVSDFRNELGQRVIMNVPGEELAEEMPKLAEYAASIMDEDQLHLNLAQAQDIAEQLRETSSHRHWQLLALAVLGNHVHVVVGVTGDPEPERILADYKVWCTRRLNRNYGQRKHWWAQSGSMKKKDTPDEIRSAVEYVRDQLNPLVVWLDPRVAARLEALASGYRRQARRQSAGS